MTSANRTLSARRDVTSSTALRFVVLLGVVSLFADMTYEGGRSATGPFLAILGASGTAVGVFAGLRELLGYGLRLFLGISGARRSVSPEHDLTRPWGFH